LSERVKRFMSLYQVLGGSACAENLLVERLAATGKAGDDEARVRAEASDLYASDELAPVAPLAALIGQLMEATHEGLVFGSARLALCAPGRCNLEKLGIDDRRPTSKVAVSGLPPTGDRGKIGVAIMAMRGDSDGDAHRCSHARSDLKIAVGRAPESGADLMSQPTRSRLENLPDWRALARIGLGQIDFYCRSLARPPSRILDIDDTGRRILATSTPEGRLQGCNRRAPARRRCRRKCGTAGSRCSRRAHCWPCAGSSGSPRALGSPLLASACGCGRCMAWRCRPHYGIDARGASARTSPHSVTLAKATSYPVLRRCRRLFKDIAPLSCN
jgi:hypothetical protein